MDRGFLRLWRRSIDSDVFVCPYLWRLWSWCLMRANYKARAIPVKTGKGSTIVQLESGEFIFGRDSAAESLKEAPSTIWDRMKKLEYMGMIAIKSNRQYSIVTICNWALYQSEEQKSQQPSDNQPTAFRQPSDTDKKDKKDKKEKNRLGRTPAPTDFPITEEMKHWVWANTSFQGNIKTETEKCLDHFRGLGEQKADWLATWRNWMRRAGEYSRKNELPQKSNNDGFAGSGKRLI